MTPGGPDAPGAPAGPAAPDARVLVTGARGLLGTEIVAELERLGRDRVGLGRAELDVTDAAAVHAAVERARPTHVIHCAAWTRVDDAETEEAAARRVNVDGTAHVVAAAEAVGARVVHLSTDYVFGEDVEPGVPIPPDHPRAPLSAYGRTKAAAEEVVEAGTGPHQIVRTSWLFGPAGRNFVDTMIALRERDRLRVVSDQIGSPTWAPDLARAVVELALDADAGVWHVTNAGRLSWFDFARAIFERIGGGPELEPVSTAGYGAPAPRPRWSVLDTGATVEALGRPLRRWSEALDDHLVRRGLAGAKGGTDGSDHLDHGRREGST